MKDGAPRQMALPQDLDRPVAEALASLSPETRAALWLHVVEGEGVRAVAASLDSNIRFLTIYPGWYMGHTVHIHFRIRKFSEATTTFNFASQMFFDDAISNAIFSSTGPYSSHTNRNPAFNAFTCISAVHP